MFDFLPVSLSALFAGAAIWLSILMPLVALTRGLNQGLAAFFLVTGVAAPLVLVYSVSDGRADTCTEQVLNDGDSADDRYRYRIVERRCAYMASAEYEVRMGRRDDFSLLRTVFRSDASQMPTAVRQTAYNEFEVVMAPAEVSEAEQTVTVRLNPLTGQAEDLIQRRQRGELTS